MHTSQIDLSITKIFQLANCALQYLVSHSFHLETFTRLCREIIICIPLVCYVVESVCISCNVKGFQE